MVEVFAVDRARVLPDVNRMWVAGQRETLTGTGEIGNIAEQSRQAWHHVVLRTYFKGASSWALVSRRPRFPLLDPRRAQIAAFAWSCSHSSADSRCSAILFK